jgi:agmatine deiminase
VAVSNGPANPTDWVALAQVGSSDYSYISWQYLNGSQTPPGSGLSSATLTFTMPATTGNYEFRFFANNGYTKLATSTTVTVQ